MNYYQVLKIEVNASTQEIKQAYRRLVKEFHPDSHHENANHETIIQLNAAYEILSDPQNRRIYDQIQALPIDDQELTNSSKYRQNKSNHASQYYRHNRQQYQYEEASQWQWLEEVYAPINHLVDKIIMALEDEIEDLSGDIFDDDLMGVFCSYLEDCRSDCERAQTILRSLPNPTLYAGIAAYIYYSLNHINDGIDELERFTLTYEESYLYTGQELFNLALEMTQLAREMVQRFS